MNTQKAIIRIAKKLLNRIRAVWKQQTVYRMQPVQPVAEGAVNDVTDPYGMISLSKEDGPLRASCMLLV